MKLKQNVQHGWVVITPANYVMDFTFSRLRTDSIEEWVKMWDKPSTWNAFYKQGYRCIKVKSTITPE